MKLWARYEQGFVNHDKFRAITANAIALWLEGKTYADEKLTDGLLPEYEVKHWRFYGGRSVALLTRSCGIKPGTDQPYAPLWEVVEDFGFKMHDYLDHNDPREVVQARIAKADAGRAARNANQAAYRERRKEERRQAASSPPALSEKPITESVTGYQRTDEVTDKHNHNQIQIHKQESLSDSLSTARAQTLDDDLGDRAAAFLERYQAFYRTHRNGAHVLIKPALDFQRACDLCRAWPDGRLDQMARILLTTDESWVEKTDRGFGVFHSRATWCDDRLKQWEVKQGVAV